MYRDKASRRRRPTVESPPGADFISPTLYDAAVPVPPADPLPQTVA
jgi:hypothetical protein